MDKAAAALLVLAVSAVCLVGFEMPNHVPTDVLAPKTSESCTVTVQMPRRTTEKPLTTREHLTLILCKLGYRPFDGAKPGAG